MCISTLPGRCASLPHDVYHTHPSTAPCIPHALSSLRLSRQRMHHQCFLLSLQLLAWHARPRCQNSARVCLLQNLVAGQMEEFKRQLHQMWFSPYSRSNVRDDTCGFEHGAVWALSLFIAWTKYRTCSACPGCFSCRPRSHEQHTSSDHRGRDSHEELRRFCPFLRGICRGGG